MSVFAFLAGIGLMTGTGLFAIRLLQGKTRFLTMTEELSMGCLLGSTLSMFAAFSANALFNLPLTLTGFCLSIGIPLLVLAGFCFPLRARKEIPLLPHAPLTQPWMKILLAVYGAWVGLRFLAFSWLLLVTPSYFDDTMDNWNMRAKLFFYHKGIVLGTPWNADVRGISSYPPSVPLAKSLLASINGQWSEALINSIHIAWFASLLALLYSVLRRRMPRAWAAAGTIALAALPVEMIHGLNAYADMFLSAHILACVAMLLLALQTGKTAALRIAGFAMALLPFVKNEGWALYLPMCVALLVITAWLMYRRDRSSQKKLMQALIAALACIALVSIPWISYKLANGLTFGNAKGIDTQLEWQPGVLQALLVNTFLEGNWNILFAVFLGACLYGWKAILRTPELLVLALSFLLPYGAQNFAFLFTGLGAEALYQTGTARGLIHLMPIVVILTMLLLCKPCHPTPHSSDTNLTSR